MHLEDGKHTPASDCNRSFPIFGKSGQEHKVEKRCLLTLPKMVILPPRKQGHRESAAGQRHRKKGRRVQRELLLRRERLGRRGQVTGVKVLMSASHLPTRTAWMTGMPVVWLVSSRHDLLRSNCVLDRSLKRKWIQALPKIRRHLQNSFENDTFLNSALCILLRIYGDYLE